eukprot:TRINITY_DN24816_c0_g1_i1.p1 TRINITY_DN24816_c0_g1~~TRINITY_DN24816_c0_g1_i1.p1  ORF type:complete len:340 (-),score=39.76 TRINITY_DN24816_c0_g1_i1:72-1091(-)
MGCIGAKPLEGPEDVVQPEGDFRVTLARKRSNEALGLRVTDCKSKSPMLRIESVSDDRTSTVGRHNARETVSRRLTVGDHILAVNGVCSTAGAMLAQLEERVLCLTVEVCNETAVVDASDNLKSAVVFVGDEERGMKSADAQLTPRLPTSALADDQKSTAYSPWSPRSRLTSTTSPASTGSTTAEEWYSAYLGFYGRSPGEAENLVKFAASRGGALPFEQAFEVIQTFDSNEGPPFPAVYKVIEPGIWSIPLPPETAREGVNSSGTPNFDRMRILQKPLPPSERKSPKTVVPLLNLASLHELSAVEETEGEIAPMDSVFSTVACVMRCAQEESRGKSRL